MLFHHRALALTIIVFGIGSCFDPVHSDAVADLGPEANGVRTGPTHRPGQPCLVCHGSLGPGPEFTVAGTVYERRGDTTTALSRITVSLTDRNNVTKSLTTNEAGNFYTPANDYQPAYPLDVALSGDGISNKQMHTQIGRTAGCATCHIGVGDAEHMPAVYLKEATDP